MCVSVRVRVCVCGSCGKDKEGELLNDRECQPHMCQRSIDTPTNTPTQTGMANMCFATFNSRYPLVWLCVCVCVCAHLCVLLSIFYNVMCQIMGNVSIPKVSIQRLYIYLLAICLIIPATAVILEIYARLSR